MRSSRECSCELVYKYSIECHHIYCTKRCTSDTKYVCRRLHQFYRIVFSKGSKLGCTPHGETVGATTLLLVSNLSTVWQTSRVHRLPWQGRWSNFSLVAMWSCWVNLKESAICKWLCAWTVGEMQMWFLYREVKCTWLKRGSNFNAPLSLWYYGTSATSTELLIVMT